MRTLPVVGGVEWGGMQSLGGRGGWGGVVCRGGSRGGGS